MINEISPIQEVTAAEAQARQASATLGRDDFLRMLVAQLENQDPLNPQDATEFTAQLAQFSSLEQLLSISAGLGDLATAQRAFTESFQGLSSAGLIGREVLTSGDRVAIGAGSTALPAFELDGAADEVELTVLDERGGRVNSIKLEDLPSGLHVVSPAELAGLDLPEGTYRFAVDALAGEEPVTLRTRVVGRVTGVVPSGEAPGLELGTLSVPFAGLLSIREARP